MARDYSRDMTPFNLKKDLEQIVSQYPSHQSEVRNFLRVNDVTDSFEGVSNEKVYELIFEEFGYPVPR